MSQQYAKAYPRKRFFVEMFTRDVTLVDCVLDLIDNAIDGLVRTRGIDLLEGLLRDLERPPGGSKLPKVEVSYSGRRVQVKDNCGGIPLSHAADDVFRFGHSDTTDANGHRGRLGVYGVGLKRAVFKMGRHFEVTSHTQEDGFRAWLDIDEWLRQDERLDDWRVPYEQLPPARSRRSAGTKVLVHSLRDEVRSVLQQSSFEAILCDHISRAYALFLGRHVDVVQNKQLVQPWPVEIGESEEVTSARRSFEADGVSVRLYAGLAPRGPGGEWKAETSGWYVACNGRLVVTADKSLLTGWGAAVLPAFHSKYRGFRGIALLAADDPLELPWTTTKRGLNQESPVYQLARTEMDKAARPVIKFLDRMYPSELRDELEERRLAEGVRPHTIASLAQEEGDAEFSAQPKTRRQPKTTKSVQYKAEIADLEAVKRHLRRPEMSAAQIGEHTLRYFLRVEGLK